VLVWETGKGVALPAPEGMEELEVRCYGAAEFHLFRVADPSAAP
jgi:hypothetical protein